MLIVYLNALEPVNSLNFAEHVILYRPYALYLKYVMRINGTVRKFVACLYHLAFGIVGDLRP